MKRIVWLFLLAVALPMTAFAGSVKFTNSGGTLSGSSAGLTLSSSTLTAMGSIMGNLGIVTFSTGGLVAGNLQMGGTFAAGGVFEITGNGTDGVPNGPIFTGTFLGPITWTLVTTNGNHSYQMSGAVIGTWFTGATVNGTVDETVNVGTGFFGRSATLGKGDANISGVPVPEPEPLTLLGTGLFGLAGVVLRKLKA